MNQVSVSTVQLLFQNNIKYKDCKKKTYLGSTPSYKYAK